MTETNKPEINYEGCKTMAGLSLDADLQEASGALVCLGLSARGADANRAGRRKVGAGVRAGRRAQETPADVGQNSASEVEELFTVRRLRNSTVNKRFA